MTNEVDLVLSAHEVTVDIGGSFLLQKVSVSLQKGQVVGLIGPNGAGKTTLINTIAGLIKPTTGSINLMGKSLSAINLEQRAKLVSVVPQHMPYTFGFNCFDLVLMGRYPYMKRFQVENKKDRNIVIESMSLMKISSLVNKPMDNLSAGEKQRVFIARGLAQQPKVLILDEPTANLDIQFQIEVMALMRALAKDGLTIMAAIHNLSLAARFCDQIILLEKGRMVKFGTPEEVLTTTNIRRVFNVDSFVAHNLLTGELELHGVNLIRPTIRDEEAISVHVIGAGGAMGKIFYTLKTSGFQVTAGILHNGTNDHRAATILGLEFSSSYYTKTVDIETRDKNDRLISNADYVVICYGIFSELDLISLRAIKPSSNLLFIEEPQLLPPDDVGGDAAKLYQQLRNRGRLTTLETIVAELGR